MTNQTRALLCLVCGVLLLAGCDNLRSQPKLKVYDSSPTFGTAARMPVAEAVPVGFLRDDEHLYQGTVDGLPATGFPVELTLATLEEGRRQYEAFCAVCHGYAGSGNGVIALEGFYPAPVSFYDPRLVAAPEGYLFQVITEGWGNMYGYASRITPENRWAIVAYVRALQLRQTDSQTAAPAAAGS
jgi:mono/diheme cytochrome c family protein